MRKWKSFLMNRNRQSRLDKQSCFMTLIEFSAVGGAFVTSISKSTVFIQNKKKPVRYKTVGIHFLKLAPKNWGQKGGKRRGRGRKVGYLIGWPQGGREFIAGPRHTGAGMTHRGDEDSCL